MIRRLAVLVLVGALFAASGCGFHLRSWEIGSAYDAVSLTTTARHAITDPLRRALAQTGVPLLDSPEDGETDGVAPGKVLVLQVINASDNLRTASVGGNARTAEYELSTAVQFALGTADGTQLAQPTWARARRVYQLDRGNLVGSNEEQTLLRRELHADVVQQIMRVVNAVSRAVPQA